MRARKWMQAAAVATALGLAGTPFAHGVDSNQAQLNGATPTMINGGDSSTLDEGGVTGYMSDSAARGSAEQTNSRGMPDTTVQDFVNGSTIGIGSSTRSDTTVDPTSSLDSSADAPNTMGTLNRGSSSTTLDSQGDASIK